MCDLLQLPMDVRISKILLVFSCGAYLFAAIGFCKTANHSIEGKNEVAQNLFILKFYYANGPF